MTKAIAHWLVRRLSAWLGAIGVTLSTEQETAVMTAIVGVISAVLLIASEKLMLGHTARVSHERIPLADSDSDRDGNS